MKKRLQSRLRPQSRPTGQPKYNPSYMDKQMYVDLKDKGFIEAKIAGKLLISMDVFLLNKSEFEIFRLKVSQRKERGVKKTRGRGNKGESMLDDNPYLDPRIISTFAEVGYPKKKLCELLHCSYPTLEKFLNNHPRIKRYFDLGKDHADMQVMKAMFKRAKGMKIPKVKFASFQGMITDQKTYYEVLPPDVNAAFNWLINRQRWTRDNEPQRENKQGKILEAMEMMLQMTEEELKEFDNGTG